MRAKKLLFLKQEMNLPTSLTPCELGEKESPFLVKRAFLRRKDFFRDDCAPRGAYLLAAESAAKEV